MDAALGPLIGAAIGGAASLLGTYLVQRSTARREETSRREAERERLERDLRTAYADWFSSSQRLLVLLATVRSTKDSAGKLVIDFNAEITAFGTRVRLLEPHPEARKKTTVLLRIVQTMAAQMLIDENAPFMQLAEQVAACARELGEFEAWLAEVRFGRTALDEHRKTL
jgi:hypothetical protein